MDVSSENQKGKSKVHPITGCARVHTCVWVHAHASARLSYVSLICQHMKEMSILAVEQENIIPIYTSSYM